MIFPPEADSTSLIVSESEGKQRLLDLDLESDPNVPFISDWDASQPHLFSGEYLGSTESITPNVDEMTRYKWLILHSPFVDAVLRFHQCFDGKPPEPTQIVPGPGSSSFISAYALWLQAKQVREVFYIPPLYYTFHHFMRLLRVKLRPVSTDQAFQEGFSMSLPNYQTHLIITDPIWYAGKSVPERVIEQIRDWQIATGSQVFVDGTFQYLKWDGSRREPTATLPLNQTFRLICPTKMLGLFGYRLAYVLAPPTLANDFRWLHESITGSSSIGDVKFACQAMRALNSPSSNRRFSELLGATYQSLEGEGLIESSINPDCGYFVFAQLTREPRQPIRAMDQTYFEQSRYPGYVRINLMRSEQLREILT